MLAWWDRLERWLIGVLGAIGLGIYLMQILGRYLVPGADVAWGEELTIYIVIWATFLTASLLVREDGHVRADLLLRMMPVTRQRWVEIANCVIALVFCLALAWFGWLAAKDSFDLSEKSNTILAFPLWVYYAALPTAALLMSVRYALRLWQFCFRFDPEHMTVHSGRES
jgi:TRAP-type C4-dicarboxylate transport system permease small subunit